MIDDVMPTLFQHDFLIGTLELLHSGFLMEGVNSVSNLLNLRNNIQLLIGVDILKTVLCQLFQLS